MKYIKAFPLLLSVIILSLVSCQVDVPTKEMVRAKQKINRAEEVKADKYAPEELKKAKESLYKCHDYVKKEDEDKAKKEAINSDNSAQKAIDKSLPLLSKDELERAKKLYDESENLYAEKFASDDFLKAGKTIKEAESLHKNKKYWASYLKSKDAYVLAKSSKEKSNMKIPEIKAEIQKLEQEYNELNAHRLKHVAQPELDKANTHISQVKEGIDKNNIKAVYPDIQEATVNLKFARNKINEAEEQERVTAQNKKKRADVLAKIESVEKLKSSLAEKDKDNKFTEVLSKAGTLLSGSRSLVDAKNFDGARAKAEEAELLLNSTSISIEKEYAQKAEPKEKEVVEEEKEQKIYVVKYRKKGTDCLWRIAKRVYNNSKLWPLIYKANKDQIKDPDLIFPGQKFVIPSLDKTKSKEEETDEKNGKESKDNIDNLDDTEEIDEIDEIEIDEELENL